MLELIQSLPTADRILIIILVVYGLLYGIGNTCNRIKAAWYNVNLIQHNLGQVLDILFYSGILYLVFLGRVN